MFGSSEVVSHGAPSAEDVRTRLSEILDLLIGSDEMPWPAEELRSWTSVVPQMTLWLPEDERKPVQDRFSGEVGRLARRRLIAKLGLTAADWTEQSQTPDLATETRSGETTPN